MTELDSTPKKGSGFLFIFLVISLLVLAYMAFIYAKKNKALNECSNASKELEVEIQGMNEMMSSYVGDMSNDLRKDFQTMLATYDDLKLKDADKSSAINDQKAKIQNLLTQLNTNKKMSAQELFAFRKENETLRHIMRGYVKQIDSLNTLNVRLSSDLDTKTQELHVTAGERDGYKQVAEENAAQVKKGAKLQAFSISSSGLRMKLNNTTESTTKARNCIQFKTAFTIGSNPLTKPGRKTVYLQVTSPSGNVLQLKENFIVATDQGSVAYSDKKDIDYSGENIDVTIYYDLKEGEAVKGSYGVKLFSEGQQIGADSFSLK